MKRISLSGLASLAAFLPAIALASPNPNSAVIHERVFNDCPGTTLVSTNGYPGQIKIEETLVGCGGGFANLHAWRLSEDGINSVPFNNGDGFRLGFDFEIAGSSKGEGGLSVAPWWAQDVDGRFNVRSTDGEIACFSGRLPFYSFTSAQGLTYAGGPIHLEVVYLPNDLSMASPATIEYKVVYNSNSYTSGPLPFDEGNPAENPPYGVWGMLNDARVGGYVQHFVTQSPEGSQLVATWSNVEYESLSNPVAVETTSWGKVKGLYAR